MSIGPVDGINSIIHKKLPAYLFQLRPGIATEQVEPRILSQCLGAVRVPLPGLQRSVHPTLTHHPAGYAAVTFCHCYICSGWSSSYQGTSHGHLNSGILWQMAIRLVSDHRAHKKTSGLQATLIKYISECLVRSIQASGLQEVILWGFDSAHPEESNLQWCGNRIP